MPCARRSGLLLAERFARVLIGVERFGELAIRLDAKHRERAAVVGDSRGELAARIEHDLVRAIALRAHFVDELEHAGAVIDRKRAHVIARRAVFPVRRVQKPAVRVRPHVRRIDGLGDQAERRQCAGLRIEPPRIDALRR